jgi:ligand-binding SRPBCC domain-containing protein
MNKKYKIPPSFQITFGKSGKSEYQLKTSQVLPLPVKKAFSFFEAPENLFEITPDWLEFRFHNKGQPSKTCQGAEFDYTVRWFSIKIKWHTKISEYIPPERFSDIQVKGPYASWEHLHTFAEVPEGTLMRDRVTYRLPLYVIGNIVNKLFIMRQLEDIFSYRAMRIAEWASGTFRSKLSSPVNY